MLKESIRMSWQNIRGNKMRTFLTMLGIIIGVTAIIALITTVGSATGEITSQFSALGAGKVSVSISGTAIKHGLNEATSRTLLRWTMWRVLTQMSPCAPMPRRTVSWWRM